MADGDVTMAIDYRGKWRHQTGVVKSKLDDKLCRLLCLLPDHDAADDRGVWKKGS